MTLDPNHYEHQDNYFDISIMNKPFLSSNPASRAYRIGRYYEFTLPIVADSAIGKYSNI